MAIAHYYLSLINLCDKNDLTRKQAVPNIDEMNFSKEDEIDTLHEDGDSPCKGLIPDILIECYF